MGHHPTRYDAIVVGGGIIGCFTAYFLALAGRKVILCERYKIASEQSSRAWGFIRQQGRHKAELPLMKESLALWREYTERQGWDSTQYVTEGVIVPAESEDDEKFVGKSYQTARSLGLPTEILSKQDLKNRMPELSGSWRCGLQTAGDGHAEPIIATYSVADQARKLGVTIMENCVVHDFVFDHESLCGVKTNAGHFIADHIVIAGGVGARKLLAKTGFNAPIQMVRSSVFRTNQMQPFTNIAMWLPKVSFRPSFDGSLVIGNGYRGAGTDSDITLESFSNLKFFLPALRKNYKHLKMQLGSDFTRSVKDLFNGKDAFHSLPEPPVNFAKIDHNLSALKAIFPHLGDIQIKESWAGRLDVTPDLIPMIDRHPEFENLIMACGFSGHGFGLAPCVGQQIGYWVCEGKPRLELSQFRCTRFKTGAYHIADAM